LPFIAADRDLREKQYAAFNGATVEDDPDFDPCLATNCNPFQDPVAPSFPTEPLPPPSLDAKQKAAFEAVVHGVFREDSKHTGSLCKVLRVLKGFCGCLHLVHAGPGCGKSFLCSAISDAINGSLGTGSFLRTASTGIAAVNIRGETIHRVLLLMKADLSPNDIAVLQQAFAGVRGLLIDEVSMISSNMLARIEGWH
jgi:hypothetical protein